LFVSSSAVENSKREHISLSVSSSAVENNKREYISTALDVTIGNPCQFE